MAVNNFIPEIWAAELQQSFLKATKFASPVVVNRDYEGDVAQQGDTVHITSVGRPTIAAYTRGGTLTYDDLVDAGRDLVINQAYEFSFKIDDIDKRQSANGGKMMSEAAREGGAGLAENSDTYVQTIMESDVTAANKIGATAITTSALAVARLVAHKQLLDENNVPQDGRYTVVPSWFHSLLVLDSNFIMYDAVKDGDMLRNGVVGRALGFEIIQANYALSSGDDWYVYSGHPAAITFADQINEVEAIRLQTTFGDGLRGLHLYGAKVTRPSALCMTLCSVT
jgi:hypothetical protein